MFKQLLFSKITREKLQDFIEAHASELYTLDIGCSNSPYSKYFPNRVGFDIEEGKGVDVIGDAHDLPFRDEEFDCIICTEVLEHLHTPQRAIDEMRRVLKKGGRLVLTTRFMFPIHDAPGDYYRYTKYGLQYLLRLWRDVSIQEETGTAEMIAILIQRLAFQINLRGGILSKIFLLTLAKCARGLRFIIKGEYGVKNSKRTKDETAIMTSGYYVFARK